MTFSSRGFKLACVVVATALLVGAAPAGGGKKTCWESTDSEKRFRTLINLERTSNQKHKLRMDPELSHAARKHSGVMLRKDRLFHTINLGDRITGWQILGENVGYGYGIEPLHAAFMDSKGHRENILHAGYRHVGVGVKTKDGKTWVMVIFEGQDDPGTTLEMPKCKIAGYLLHSHRSVTNTPHGHSYYPHPARLE